MDHSYGGGGVTVGSRHMAVPVHRQVSTGSPRSVRAGWYGPHAAPELLLRRFLCSAHTVKLACSLRSGPVAGDRTAFEKNVTRSPELPRTAGQGHINPPFVQYYR